jgi:sirohydrochlorin ferrochelatase
VTGPALLVIGHGTRSAAGVAQYWSLVDQVGRAAPGLAVGGGFIELARPDLDTAIDALAAEGHGHIVAVPLVLLGAGHLKSDGPAALDRGRSRHPRVCFTYGRDLGVHPLVLDAASARVGQALAGLAGYPDDPSSTAVVLVGRGASDPDANSDLYKVARLLSDSRGLGPVEPAFVSLATPSVTDALDRSVALGARRVAVVPYFLFTGRLVERIAEQARHWARSHPGIQVVVGEEMGPDPRVARLVLERYDEARRGGATMNCDCCIYRTPLPGYEHRVGAVSAHPHHGPAHVHEV